MIRKLLLAWAIWIYATLLVALADAVLQRNGPAILTLCILLAICLPKQWRSGSGRI